MKKVPRITSAAQALKESDSLENIWSRETFLTQRVLIYMAELLEEQRLKKRGDPQQWHRFLKKCLKQKMSVQQALDLWHSL